MKNSPSSASCPNKESYRPLPPPYLEIEERVRYSETDQMGVAHNKGYFEWFEIGRTEYCRKKQIPYKDIEARGHALVVVEAFCRYKKALRYDEPFLIRVALREMTPKKAVFGYELRTKDDLALIAHGYTTHIAVNKKGEVCPLPEDLVEKMKRPLAD
jgi:acyl-CoA thioester hydrolase